MDNVFFSFVETYAEDIKAFFEALRNFFEAIIGKFTAGGDAEAE